MSTTTEVIYGIGLKIPYEPTLDDIKNIRMFLKQHEQTLMKLNKPAIKGICDIVSAETVSDTDLMNLSNLLNSVDCNVSAQNHAYAIASNIFGHETNVRPQIDIDHAEETAYIVFAQTYPWLYTDEEKQLTIDSITKMLSHLGAELQLKNPDADDVRIEHFG